MRSTIHVWLMLLLAALLAGCGSNFEWLPSSTQNIAPLAHAGTDQSVSFNTLVTLDGSASTASNGQTLTYFWTGASPSGSTVALLNPTGAQPTFVPNAVGTYTFTLYVNDGKKYSLPATVKVVSSPVANAGPNQSNVIVNSTVTLDGSGSSAPAGDTLSYKWTFASFPTASAPLLTITDPQKPTFVPTAVGTYSLNLIVTDGTVSSTPAPVIINVINNTGGIAVTW